MPSPTRIPVVLTRNDLVSRLEALAPATAVFDCDGTLWSGDAGSSFMHWTVHNRLLSPEKIDWLNARYEGYRQGKVSEAAICGEMVQVYAGLTEATLRQAAAEFFREHIEPHIFPELRDVVGTLGERGTQIWAVSSTNHWVIEEGARRFDIPPDRVLAARVAIEGGIITDRLLDVPTDEGKVAALRHAGITHPDAVFGNSVHDAAMLAVARVAFSIYPTGCLLERSAREGWPVFHPAPQNFTSAKHEEAAATTLSGARE